MKKILLALTILISLNASAQEWRIEIEPLHFGAEETPIYNDTADRFLVRIAENKGDSMKVYAVMYNSRTQIPVRPGREYIMPKSILLLLYDIEGNLAQVNQVMAQFGMVAIKEED